MHRSVDVEHAVRHALLRGADLLQQSDAVLAEHLGAVASIPLHLAADLCDGPGRDAVVRELTAQGTPEARAVLYAMAAANDGELERLAGAAARSMLPGLADPPWLRDATAPIELRRVIGLVGRLDPAEQAVLYVFRRARRAHGVLVEIEPGRERPREITWASNEDARAWLKKLKRGTWQNQVAYEVSFDDVGRGVSLLEGMMHNTAHAQLQAMDDWPLAADLERADTLPALPSLLVLLRKSLRSALALDEWPYLDGTPWAPWRPVAAARSRPAAHTADGLTRTPVSTGRGLEAVWKLAGSSPALRHAVGELYEAESVALTGGDGAPRAEAALRTVRFETLDRPALDPVRVWALASAGQTALVGSSFVEAAARLTEAYVLLADGGGDGDDGAGVPLVDQAELRSAIGVAVQGVQLRLGGMMSQLGAAETLAQISDAELEQAPGLMNRLRTISEGYIDARQWQPATLCLDAAGMVGFLTRTVSPAHRLAYVEVIGAVADAKARQGDVLMGLRATSDGLGEAIEELTAEPTARSIKILRASLRMAALMPVILAAPGRHPLGVECEDLRHRADTTSHETGPTLDESARRLLQAARTLKAKLDEIIANNSPEPR
ncbi:hypothetical protein [Promicromonospora sp. NPDC060271]|uniref:hypothetical protein n=1 Tax=Promicromonospora sp. NPDC060271 TaxID=3347089 RepID=UPI0036504D09